MAERVGYPSPRVEGLKLAGRNRDLLDERYPQFEGFSEQEITEFAKQRQDPFKSDIARSWLYDRYFPFTFATSLEILHNIEDAQDAAQVSFIKAFANLEAFAIHSDCSFKQWLTLIAVNTSITQRRLKDNNSLSLDTLIQDEHVYKTSGSHQKGSFKESLIEDKPNPEETSLIQETVQELRTSLQQLTNSLPERWQKIIHLRFYEDLSQAEIAEILGKTENNVKVTQYKAIARLRGKIGSHLRLAG